MNINKKQKSIIIFLTLFISIFGIATATTYLGPIQLQDDDTYILSDGVIKNFRFESFDGEKLGYKDEDGNYILKTSAKNNKLKFEIDDNWNISKSDIELMDAYIVGDEVKYYYKVSMHNELTVYTNIAAREAVKHIEGRSKDYKLGHYNHYFILGDKDQDSEWSKYATFNYNDFYGDKDDDDGTNDFRSFNNKYNKFGGDLRMVFDIADSPLPSAFQSRDGANYSKNFDYIGVSSASVEGQQFGQLSNTEPEFVVQTPKEFDDKIGGGVSNEGDIDGTPKSIKGGFKTKWNPNIDVDIVKMGQWSEMQPGTSPGSSLFPTQKDGSPIYDNTKDVQDSQDDCALTYNIGRISPVVKYHEAVLSYEYRKLATQDYYTDDPWDWFATEVRLKKNEHHTETHAKPASIHVNNQYIRSEIRVTFNIFTSYSNLDTKETQESKEKNPLPVEDTEGQLWGIIVDGWGGGETFRADAPAIFGTIINIILIFIVIAVVIYVLIQFIIPYLVRKKSKEKIVGLFKN